MAILKKLDHDKWIVVAGLVVEMLMI